MDQVIFFNHTVRGGAVTPGGTVVHLRGVIMTFAYTAVFRPIPGIKPKILFEIWKAEVLMIPKHPLLFYRSKIYEVMALTIFFAKFLF